MYPWSCCRACLGTQNLYPIFPNPEHGDKFSSIIFTATGLKVEINDILPQEMCSICINFINDSIKFRKTCEASHQLLLNGVKNKRFDNIKIESSLFKLENEHATAIDLSNLIDDSFRNNCDTKPLDLYQCNDNSNGATTESIENDPTQIEYETSVQEFIKKNRIVDKISEKTNNVQNKEIPKLEMKPRLEKETEKIEKIEQNQECEIEQTEQNQECEHCHKVLKTKQSLIKHYMIHNGVKFVCEHCGKGFNTKRHLLRHCRAKHGYEKTDKCSYCDYTASNAELVKVHERLHTGEKPFVCSECGASFHSKGTYRQHLAIHLPEKTVQCDLCPARFKSITLKNIHKNRHKDAQSTFTCKVCGNSFRRRYHAVRHLQKIHALAPDKHLIDKQKIG